MPPRRDAEFALKGEVPDPSATWDVIVTCVNWPRVLFEAKGRHLKLDHGIEESPHDLEYHMCGECIEAVLRAETSWQLYVWKEEDQ